MNINLENLHSFLIYGFLGSLISYVLVKTLIKLRGIDDPKEISRLMFIPLLIPFVAVFASFFITSGQCPVGFRDDGGYYQVFAALCNGTVVAGGFFTPVLLVGFSLALIKGSASLILSQRMGKRHYIKDLALRRKAIEKLKTLSVRAEIKCPRLVVTKHNFARCCTFGYKEPTIVISQGVLKYFEDEELESILAHEIGHIVRVDSLKNWVGQLLRDILFFTPFSFLAFRELKNQHEKAADDIAIALTNKPIVFAETLIKFWKYSPKGFLNSALSASPGFAKSADGLEQRVKRSIGEEETRKKRPWSVIAHSGGIIISTVGLLLIVC